MLTLVVSASSFSLSMKSMAALAEGVPAWKEDKAIDALRMPATAKALLAVTGSVKDANGQSLPGVNIVEKGTANGTTTDADGRFSLNVTGENSVLVFTFIGYLSQSVTVGTRTSFDIVLEADTKVLEEVVVVGYGTQKVSELTSAVTGVKEEDFNKGPIPNSPLQLIQGKVPGLAISRAGQGNPNGEVQMQLRGISTVRGNASPLIVIDGIPGGSLNTIAPEDIESIDVLRDGSASAIYGTRGSNGVVIITTKKGKLGSPSIQYSAYTYYEQYAKKPEALTAGEYRQLKNDFANSDNITLKNKAGSIIDYGGDSNWLDEITQNKLSQIHNLSISGANQRTNYYAAVNFRDIQGLVKRSFNQVMNYRLALTHAVFDDRLVFNFNISNSFAKARPNSGSYLGAMLRNPTLPVYNPDGTYHEEYVFGVGGNPVAALYDYENDMATSNNLIISKVTLNLTDALKASVQGAFQRNGNLRGSYSKREAYASIMAGSHGGASRSTEQSTDRTLEATLSYDKLIGNAHKLNVVGGYSYQDFTNEAFGASNREFITDDNTYNNLNAGQDLKDGIYKDNDVWSSKRSSKLIAFFGRAIYSYNDKYMFTAGVRREGSSKFGKDNKWGFFPAVTAGWRISEENFLKDNSIIDDLKLRIGYGVTGNQGIQEYVSLERLSPGGTMLYNGDWIVGYVPSSNPNPNLRWEKKAETNLGIDMGMYNNRLMLNLDFYDRTTTDLLFEYTVPVPPNLYNTLWTNVGGITNKGIELALNVVPITKSKFEWNSNFNISYNWNKLVSLSNDFYQTKFQDQEDLGAPGLSNVPGFRLEEGQPIGNMFGYGFAGFTEDGKWLFWDADNETKVTASEAQYEDKRIVGNGLPKYWLGFTNTFTMGSFDATVMLRGAFGFDILNMERLFYENRKMIPSNILKSGLTSPVVDDPQFSDYYVEKGDYLKLDNITVGYTLPIKASFISNARVYVSTRNLLTFTGYKGQDPELGINGLSPGMDRTGSYPSTRTFALGCNLKF